MERSIWREGWGRIESWWGKLPGASILAPPPEGGELAVTQQEETAREEPLRAELYSLHQLDQHAQALAMGHELAEGRGPDRLLQRLRHNEQILSATYQRLTQRTESDQAMPPAAEWLLDNFYIIKEQVRIARHDLPRSYSRALPRLARGPAADYPRVYHISTDLVAHRDGAVDDASLSAVIRAYQGVRPLTLGELWAIPIMLRLALLENLRRLALHIDADLADRSLAAEWAAKMVQVVEKKPADLVMVLADMARANPPINSAFVTEFTRQFQGQSTHYAFALSWLEHRIADQGLTIEHLVQRENQMQAADRVSCGNSVTSLRMLGATDWREFVETQSLVEQVLRGDPAGLYAKMDFSTRDQYRHVVEAISLHADLNEPEVAKEAVRLAGLSTTGDAREGHVGHYLIDEGRSELERAVGMRVPLRLSVERTVLRSPLFFYLGACALLTALIMAAVISAASLQEMPWWMAWVIVCAALWCSFQLALNLVNWMAALLLGPRPLPRLDFRDGIPPEHRSIVVIPTMLSSEAAVDTLLERLELHYAGNRDPHLHFALLTDWKDAPQEHMPGDEELLARARVGVEALNAKYGKPEYDTIFYLLHRPRLWNPSEQVWMGYERKRGKLEHFNAVVRGATPDAFTTAVGDLEVLQRVRYVITLDGDTQMPRDAARHMIETMAHPLNRPVYDAQRGRVVDGYGILQPRTAITLNSSTRSWFARISAPGAGIDPYTRVVSDVYQDLFGEGTFVGKGIYDVEAFEKSCGHLPANTILSHDLLESTFARSGLVSDIELYEDYPSAYFSDAKRKHRWVRGDWQIAWWLLPTVPTADGKHEPNPLSMLSRWKIFDNLRRSLVAPAMLALLMVAWLSPSQGAGIAASLLVMAVVFLAPMLALAADAVRKPDHLPWRIHWHSLGTDLFYRLAQLIFGLAMLPHEAVTHLDATLRSLWRMLISRKHLLQWMTASDSEITARADFPGVFIQAGSASIIGAVIFAALTVEAPQNLAASSLIVALWIVSPCLAWYVSKPIRKREVRLSRDKRIFLRKVARRTWRYFEQYVTAEENWLPPDNYQEHPVAKVAERTSSTNIGMGLLSNLAAYDLGYVSTGGLLRRTQDTFETLDKLERYRGHFYNWYDTRTLKPLLPLYISSVDSGNMAIHLLVLREGLAELSDSPVLAPHAIEGIQDTARVLLDVLRQRAMEEQAPAEMAELARKAGHVDQRRGESAPIAGGGGATASADSRHFRRDSETRLWR